MEENGEFVIDDEDYGAVKIDPNTTEPTDISRRMATENMGTITGDRDSGTFDFTPNDADTRKMMEGYGQESIHYQDGHPEFKPFTKHNTEWGEVECEVEIGYMSDKRNTNVAGPRTSNFAQADDALAIKISEQTGKTVTGTDIQRFREKNNLSWHEVEDRATMQLVPQKIHDSARHSGGVAQAKYEMAWGNIAIDDGVSIVPNRAEAEPDLVNHLISGGSKMAEEIKKAINKVTRGDYKYSDLSSAYTAQTALTGSITRLGEICGAMNTAALQFSEASTELSGRANLTAYYMQHTDTLSYEGLMGTYTSAIASAGSAAAGYELVKSTLEENGYSVSNLGSVSNAVQDAIQREAEEQARRAEEAKWAKIGLTGLVIVGGIVASVVTGGAAAPIVIGAISGAVMAGGNTAIDQYAEHGWDTDNWDYAEIGKDAFVGGVTGAATAWIGGNLTKGVTNLASSTQWGSTLLNSSNAYVRVGTGAVIGSASEVVSGVGSRGRPQKILCNRQSMTV